ISEHSLEEIFARLQKGIKSTFSVYLRPNGQYNYLFIFMLIFFVMIIFSPKSEIYALLKDNVFVLAFTFLYLGANFMVISWTYPNMGLSGARFLYSFYIPVLYIMDRKITQIGAMDLEMKIFKVSIETGRLRQATNWVVSILFLVDFWFVVTAQMVSPDRWFGK
ncbi:hypothetical protein ACFLYP_03890, partial [Chloroflexota bacterium]